MVRARTYAAAGDDLEIIQSNHQDFAIFSGPGAIVVGHERELSCRIDLDPRRPGRRKTSASDSTIIRPVKFRQRRIAMRERRIPVATVRGDGQAVRLVALRRTGVQGNTRQEGTGFGIEPQDLVGQGDRDVHGCVPRVLDWKRPVSTACRCGESDGEQDSRAPDQNCGSSTHRPVFMSET